jgi:N-acyl-D-aspartate/D-glutamate deacylase
MPIGLNVKFETAIVKRAKAPANVALIGRTLGDIAQERGTTAVDAMIDIALAEPDLDVSFGFEGLGHNAAEKIGEFLADKHISIGAGDGGAHLARFSTYGDTGFLFSQYVRRDDGMPLEEAVRKLTSDVAKVWGLANRGLIRNGFAADMLLFDPKTIDRGPEIAVSDLPGGEGFRYLRHAVGVDKVWINGALTYAVAGGYTPARAGAITKGGAIQKNSAPAESPKPLRAWTYPIPGEDWAAIAARTLPNLPTEQAIAHLQSWNLYLAYRPAPAEVTPTDVLFTEPPVAA